jgi:flagellin-like protein
MRLINDRRGISPLIATIILISICVAGGLLIYSIFFSTGGTLTAKGELTVEAIDLVKDTDGNIVFTITIKNSGNKPIHGTDANRLRVTLGSDSVVLAGGAKSSGGNLPDAANLQPGQSISVDLYYSNDGDNTNDDISGTYVVGNSYNVVIQAKFSDGSTFTTTTSVKCRSA